MIKKIDGGLLGSSVYIVYTEESKRAMIVDCGVPIRSITDFVRQEGLLVDYMNLACIENKFKLGCYPFSVFGPEVYRSFCD